MCAVSAAQLVAEVKVQGADQAKSDLSSIGQSTDQAQKGFGQMMKQGLANAASFAIFNVGAKAVDFLKDQLTDTISVAMQHQEIMSQTAAVIQSTGDASGMTAQSIGDLALSLSKVTPFSDDTIQSGENLLLTFKGIGKDVFPQVTKTMLDMSQAMGMDTKSAALQLGKALDDPAKGMTALTREGVTFSDKQKEMIKQMVAVGDKAGAQKIILQELGSEFGDSATKAGQTFGGQLQILQNNLEDTKQKIGSALLPILSGLVTNISGSVLPAIQKFGDFLQSPAFQSFAKVVSTDITGAMQKVATYFQSPAFQSFAKIMETDVKNAISTVGSIIKTDIVPVVNSFINVLKSPQFQAFAAMVGNLVKTYLAGLKSELDFIKPIIEGIFNFIQNVALPALTGLGNGLSSVINWFQKGGPIVQLVEDALIGVGVAIAAIGIANFLTMLPGLFAGLTTWAIEQGAVALATLATALPYIAIGALIALVVTGIILAIQHWGDIVKWLTGVWSAVAGFFEWLWGQISGFFVGVGQWFADRFTEAYNGVTGAFGAVGKWFQDLWQGIVDDFNSILGGLGKLAGNIWNGITDAVKSGFNFIIDLINNVIKTVDSIHVGGFGINIPLIPHLAMGGLIAQAGMALVGERGPELVQLPAGARVIPNNQLGSLGSAGGSEQVIHIQVYLDGKDITNNVMTRAVKSTRTSGPIRSNV